MEEVTFDPGLIQAIFKHIWTRRALEREKNEGNDGTECEQVGTGTLKKTRTTSANSNALKLSCELLRIFITGFELDDEAVQRSAMIAEAEGAGKIEGTHLERILPQLLLDF
ncbi:PREDICTED: centromere protein X-like isoform X1 [Populus euphratica]|uniref:Centromere protein X-like isoform X1 n=1 Tax=Populus euphratica TaxID=75702 RepID=A0AAJ6XCD5_POPEU|nr:PREDICTED: centromere protein X-like isoform X1 [Populus euphratica]